MTEESAVKVCVRVRPLIKREESESSEPLQLFWRADKQIIHQLDDDGGQVKSFSFDRVFSAEESTAQLYQDIAKPLVVSAVEGYNGTIFAYGQTSSGKTFTMMGREHNPGVIPLAMADVFKTIKTCPKKEFLLRVSYMEIYNETVTDLLCDSWKRKPLEIREGNYKNVYVADLTEELVTSPEQALSWITKGEKNRHYGKTKMNQRSSRSHTIFRMILESRERTDLASGENADGAIIVSHLNLVDLAGAERASQTGAEGTRFKEGCNINRSLFTLGQVIKKLSDECQKGFLNYRDSKLTRILQNSLGGNAKTVIICTITPVTVDETVSTLQFASAAKRMKNDPHVTEVSDEGALLSRYRNEIVDLKRRLQEVSSVTQTTATERQSLCQLLQEKEQLQREQEDRIRNLTKLLVTSNVALVPKIPKRRVTWGGKLLRSAHLVKEDHGSSDMSFAEPYIKKRRADCTLPEEGDDLDEFESRFEFTAFEEINMDMETSNITVRSSSEGGNFFDSPRANELMSKVASLECQLEAETQSKLTAEERSVQLQLKISELEKCLETQAEPSGDKISELEKCLETHDEQSGDKISELEKRLETQAEPSEDKISELEKRMMELQHLLQTEVEQRQTAEEKIYSLELKVSEQEKPSEALTCIECKQMKRDLEEAIQFCETFGFEKDGVIAERDLAKHTLEIVTRDLESLKAEKESLQKDKDALQKDIEERRDAEEFEKLEQESKKEYERELEVENSRLQEASKQSEDIIQKLQADLLQMSSELKKKSDLTSELQTLNDKDLVKEVTQLRRSLDDAECLSLETKKEWAFLRTENISLKARDAMLTTDQEKMETDVKSLQEKLEHEKARFRKMQTDLQKELMGAFDENTKLTSLLDGKVPKNLTDNFVLEKTVSELRLQLDQSHEREKTLQTNMDELETLPVKVDELLKQVCVLTEELSSVKEEKEAVQSSLDEDNKKLKDAQEQLLKMESDLVEAQLKEHELTQELTETSQQLQTIQTDLQNVMQENDSLSRTLEEVTQKSLQLGEELEGVRTERDNLQSNITGSIQTNPEEIENLRFTISSINEERDQLKEIVQVLRDERDQLKSDMEENVEMMIESQGELRDTQEKVKELQGKILNLESSRGQVDDQREQENCEDGQLEKLRDQIRQLEEKLSSVAGEEDLSMSERHEALEKIQVNIKSLTEERDQLQKRVEELENDNIELKKHLEENAEREHQHGSNEENVAEIQQIETLKSEIETLTEERNQLTLNLQEISQQVCALTEELKQEKEALMSIQTRSNEDHENLKDAQEQLLKMESDLVDAQLKEHELTQQVTEMSQQLQTIQTDLQNVMQENDSLSRSLEEVTQKSLQLGEELEGVCAERDNLQSNMTGGVQTKPEEIENLHFAISSITEERDQLKEIVQVLRDERDQLKSDMEESNGLVLQVQQENAGPQLQTDITQHEELMKLKEELDAAIEEKNQLKSDIQENVEMMIENQDELRGALEKVKDLEKTVSELESKLQASGQQINEPQEQMLQLRDELEGVCPEREHLLSERNMSSLDESEVVEKMKSNINTLTEERDQLQEILKGLREETEELRRDQQEKQEMMMQFSEELQSTAAERDELSSERTRQEEEMERLRSVTVESDQLLETLQTLTEERDQLKKDQQQQDEMLVELREQLQAASVERDHLLSEKTNSDLQRKTLEEIKTGLASVTEEKEQLMEILQSNREEKNLLRKDLEEKDDLVAELQSTCAEKEQLLSERSRELQEKTSEIKSAKENISTLTEEKSQLILVLQGVREERDQLKREQLEKSETMLELRQELLSTCAERDQLLAEKRKWDISSACSSMMSSSEGGDLQEILQGVRELIQGQGELKQKKHQVSDQSSPTDKQNPAQIQQIQALGEEMEALRNERVVLRRDLQESAEISKTYQELLHVTKEELKQLQKENADVVARSAEEESRLQQQLSLMDEDLVALRTIRDQHKTEIQNLQSQLTSLTKHKDELQETLERVREEHEQLRCDLQQSEMMRTQLSDELESRGDMKEQLENEKTRAEQTLESLREIEEERDQLKRVMEQKMEQMTHIESRAGELEKQKIFLESEVHSLSQSLTEVNCSVSSGTDQSHLQSQQRSAEMIAEIDTSHEKLQVTFRKLQDIVDHPSDSLADVNRAECTVIYQLLAFIPKSQRNVHGELTLRTTQLNHVLLKTAETFKRLAERYKTHFEMEMQRDVASFEESRMQDLLVITTRDPSQSFRALQRDFQQVWDQRLSHLLERRGQYLQKVESVVKLLEDGLAQHLVAVSEERQERSQGVEELSRLLRSPDTSTIIQLLERRAVLRTKATEHLRSRRAALLDQFHAEISLLKSNSAESERRLKEQRRETLTLLRTPDEIQPKTEAELLQDNQRLTLQLQHTQRQMKVIQTQMKDVKSQADASNQKRLQELSTELKEKEVLIQKLKAKLKEAETLSKKDLTPADVQLESLKDKLVKMELDHIAITTSRDKELGQMSSMLEHRADVIRKLKETLRKIQQDDEQSFMDGDEPDLHLNTRAVTSLKEKKLDELQKKSAQFESIVSKQQEEIMKWKRRAYKIRESKKEGPCTPTKRQAPLMETEVNSPNKMFLDSPKSKFFDVRSSAPVSINCPTRFFDNSALGTVPDCSSSTAAASGGAQGADWWQIPNASPAKPSASGNANGCPTQ
ncbi:centromere-associated protein E isoform X2 [Triplophysa dalaica]|uniref:centromere-associated protein E isoform X2 n=1 Tax=Triplophysa dalaica TaxID=1582913 RepID=UPI0024E000B2|nr:centromere-associated protein E isoform X2 [Triplophysa dalaica]